MYNFFDSCDNEFNFYRNSITKALALQLGWISLFSIKQCRFDYFRSFQSFWKYEQYWKNLFGS